MPEYRELWASWLTFMRWFIAMEQAKLLHLLVLQNIWADSTVTEQTRLKDPLARSGMVYTLRADSKVQRGSKGHQQPIYPPTKPILSSLKLKGVHFSPRTIILDLDKLWLQVQMHTHVVGQVYTRAQWLNSICKVPADKRKFRIGMALDFGMYILAFVTLDNIFTPHWAASRDMLPMQHVDVCSEFAVFLRGVANWISERRSAQSGIRGGLAANAVRTSGNRVFGGVGTYTVNELFFIAGLSVFLTESEVFDCPSRVARLCLAFWVFANRAQTGLEKFLHKHYRGYVLTATTEQRLKFGSWLYVFGKEVVFVSARMHKLQQDYEECVNSWENDEQSKFVCNEEDGLFDVFEPTLIREGLLKYPSLGVLIFGKDAWNTLAWSAGIQVGTGANPLSQCFESLDISLTKRTNLNLSMYPTLFVDRLNEKRLPVESFHGNDKALWSIAPLFPSNVQGRSTSKLYMKTADERRRTSFRYTVQHTRIAAIGPLEYCGIVRIIRVPGNSKIEYLSICRQDPQVPVKYRSRENAQIQYISEGGYGRGASQKGKKRKRSTMSRGGWSTKASAKDLAKAAAKASVMTVKVKPLSVSALQNSPEKCSVVKLKKKRLSADAKIALQQRPH